MDPCPICQDDQDDHEPGECLVGLSPSPGDDRRAYLREHPDEQDAEPGDDRRAGHGGCSD